MSDSVPEAATIDADNFTVQYLGSDTSDYHTQIDALLDAHTDDLTLFSDLLGDGQDTPTTSDLDFYKSPSYHAIIATNTDNDLIGVLCFKPGDTRESLPYDNTTYIALVLVHEDYRNNGVWTAMETLLSLRVTVEPDFPNRLALSTSDSNTAAKSAYSSSGYTEIARIPNHRVDGSDTIYYTRPVRAPES